MSLTEESKVCINDEIDDLIGCTNVETFAEPINTHFSREHSVEHVVLQVLQGLGRGKESCFVHAPIISTGSDGSRPLVCHLGNWSEAAAILNKKCILRIGTVSVN